MLFALKTLAFAAAALLVPRTAAETHEITVGFNSTITFTPNNIAAAVGDVVLFSFVSKNHSATQTTFEEPCTPLTGGINSGFEPVPANATSDFPKFSFRVHTRHPLWFSCQQVDHCAVLGMVFAVNPTEEETFAEFQARATGQIS